MNHVYVLRRLLSRDDVEEDGAHYANRGASVDQSDLLSS